MGTGLKACLITTVVVIIILFLVILIPLSFDGVEYYEYGLKKQRSTGKVDRDKVYAEGRYAIGPDYGFVKFIAGANNIDFNEISVWSKDKLAVELTCQMQYFLSQDSIGKLHERFDVEYKDIIEDNALNALKDAATQYEVRQMFRERSVVEEGMLENVRRRLGGICCAEDCSESTCVPGCKRRQTCTDNELGLYADVKYFQLQYLDIPKELKDNFLKQLVEFQKNEIAENKQTALLVRKATQGKVAFREIQKDQVVQNSTALANMIIAKARADAGALIDDAHSEGLMHLYNETNLATQSDRQRFDYLRTMRNQEKAHFTIGYTTLVAGPLK